MAPYLTALVPAFNEEVSLAHNVGLLHDQLIALGISFEIVIVDDGSTDRTGAIADELASANPLISIVHHQTNQGLGGGFVTGVSAARGEWLILIPADLPLDLGELQRYLDMAPVADVVVGIRSDRSDYSRLRLVVSWVNITLIRLLFGMRERQFQYVCMYRLSVLRQIRIEYGHSAFFHAEILIKARALGYRLAEVEISYSPRASGRATGARASLIFRTARDMLHFWTRWVRWGGRAVTGR